MKILVTGATGAVGSEVVRHLSLNPNCEVVGTSRVETSTTTGWDLCASPVPLSLRREWDLVVHSAASTRWTMTVDEARVANIASTEAVCGVLSRSTRLVQVSTAFAVPSVMSEEQSAPAAYRNTYEWSKRLSEDLAVDIHPETVVVRPPLLIGRRGDGWISRFAGLYLVARGLCAGQIPAVVGDLKGYAELATTCDVAALIGEIAFGGIEFDHGVRHIIGSGSQAPRMAELVTALFEAMNAWREPRGIPPLVEVPIITGDTWRRLYRPFLRDELRPSKLASLDLWAAFEPYMSIEEPLEASWQVPSPLDALGGCIEYWASENSTVASSTPQPWKY